MDAASLKPAVLRRCSPPAAWEAFFLIGIFPAGSSLKWTKVQLFSGGRTPGRHCVSALEAMDGTIGEELILFGHENGVEEVRRKLPRETFDRSRDGWGLRTETGLDWQGTWPSLTLTSREPGFVARTRSRDVLWWIHMQPVLSYWGVFGSLEFEKNGSRHTGLGIVEHAWGGEVPFDPGRLSPGRWQWDVLAFEDGTACAGLATSLFGRNLGLRSGGTAPGTAFQYGRGMKVRVSEWEILDGRRTPSIWKGTMMLGPRRFDYEARRSTPPAPVLPQGGFMGFGFEGRWRDAPGRTFAGTGFTEFRAA
ncbi:MAG: hypothetical protein KIT79_05755 [Deltaproteobacteria bacterium]|nr:hypothetical protein [Deltaproteobacteria bacterium]